MKKFTYEAKDTRTAKRVKSTVTAESDKAAAKVLVAQGLSPLKITEQQASTRLFERATNRITSKDKVVLTRQLATLIEAGIPITQALQTVADQTQNKRLRTIIQEVVESVEGGSSLHDACARHSVVFGQLFLALVAAGEASGTLDQTLVRIAEQQEKDDETLSGIRGALTYPAIVFLVIVVVMVFMLAVVVPQVEKIYQDLHKSLPLVTQIMVTSSHIIVQFWWIFVLTAGAGGYAAYRYVRTEQGKLTIDRWKLSIPGVRNLYRRLYIARFTRTGQTLLGSGVAMLDMLTIAGDSIDNRVMKRTIDKAALQVQSGKTLSAALRGKEGIPDLLPQMISIGEKSGKIDAMLGKSAKIYEQELRDTIRVISTSIEPVLMVFLAFFAGVMIAAILLPIYSLSGSVQV